MHVYNCLIYIYIYIYLFIGGKDADVVLHLMRAARY